MVYVSYNSYVISELIGSSLMVLRANYSDTTMHLTKVHSTLIWFVGL